MSNFLFDGSWPEGISVQVTLTEYGGFRRNVEKSGGENGGQRVYGHVRKALDFLRAQDFSKMADGRYPIEGEHSFALLQRYTTRPVEKCRPEAHRKYIDIQYLVEGEECLGWCPVSPDLAVSEYYDAQKDVEFYQKLVPDSSIVLSQGLFAVLFPLDVHRPCASLDDRKPSAVTKVVVKIEVDLV